MATVEPNFCSNTIDLTKCITSLVQIFRSFKIVNTRMLCLESRESIFNSIAEKIGEILKLERGPTVMLEHQLFEPRSRLILFNMSLELSD